MQKLYYQFPGTWFGDCMPFGKGDKFYLYHQMCIRDRNWNQMSLIVQMGRNDILIIQGRDKYEDYFYRDIPASI